MKAIQASQFGAPEVLKIAEVETPAPAAKQVLVRIHAVGVNPVDTYIRTGTHSVVPKLPYTPGMDAAGTVEAVGDEVSKFKEGDRVYTAGSLSGTYAEYCLCNEDQLGSLPVNVSFEQGAGIWTPYATAYRALFQKAAASDGEAVLIHGASGGVGLAAVQWAKAAGLTVIGTASSDEGKKLVAENGADAVFDHTDGSHFAQVREFTNDVGVPVIIEMLANVNLERDFECLAPRGRIVVVGSRGSLMFSPRFLMAKDATVTGMALFNSLPAERDEIHAAISRGLESGELDPLVSRRFPLEEAAAAHHAVIEDKAAGKIVLIP